MDKENIPAFLNIASAGSQRADMKVWLWLLLAFTAIFIDISFPLAFAGSPVGVIVPVLFSAAAAIFVFLYFAVKRCLSRHISYAIIYNAAVTAVTAALFYTLSFFISPSAKRRSARLGRISFALHF